MESNPNKKQQRRRRASQRFNPLGPSNFELEEFDFTNKEVDEKFADNHLSIVEKLQSFDPQLREMATISLSQIEHFSEELLTHLYEKDAFKYLIQRLMDPNPQIILSSLMALTNMTESGANIQGKSVGDIIINNGILILLESILSDFQKAHESRQLDVNSDQFAVKIAIVDHSYKLMSRLAEVVSEDLIDNFLQSKVTSSSLYFIMNCDEAKILTGIGSYLQILTETSVKLCQQISETLDFLKRLVVISEAGFATQELKAYMLGSLYNYICTLERNGITPNGKDELVLKVFEGIFSILEIRIFDEVSNLLKIYEDNKGKKTVQAEQSDRLNPNQTVEEPLNHDDENENEAPVDPNVVQDEDNLVDMRLKQALGIWGDSASAIQICLGVIINIFESADAVDDGWKDEDDEEEETTNPKLNKYEPSCTSFMLAMTPEVREKILGCLINKCQWIKDKAYEDMMGNLRMVSDQCKKIVEFAFPSVMNILLNIEYTDKKNNQNTLDTLAEQMFKLCLEEWKYYLEILYENNNVEKDAEESNDKEDVTFEQNIVNDILKVMSHLMQNSSVNLVGLIDIHDFIKVQTNTFDYLSEESKLATIELVGARCHPKHNITKDENALVGDFLLQLLQSENVMIIGEALNALFDVYSDEAYDDIFVAKNFMEVLAYGQTIFKKKIDEAKEELPMESYSLLRNHLLNLKRFIKYKKEHVGK